MPRMLHYSVLDVFAEQPLAGNPLAVFHDGRGLTTDHMQALARETNLSETVFVLPSIDPAQEVAEGVHVRIFTTQEELPFAGHPTLGTATWLHLNHPTLLGADSLMLRMKAGLIPVHFAPAQPSELGVYASMRQNDPVFGAEYDPVEVAAVLGIDPADLLPGYRPQTVSTANPFCIVALRSVEALTQLNIPQREASPWLHKRATRWFYCIAPTDSPTRWRARMQFYGGEDPATGSAAGPCIAWLVSNRLAAPDTILHIEQGIEIRRGSVLSVQASQTLNRCTTYASPGAPFLWQPEAIPYLDFRLFYTTAEPQSPIAARDTAGRWIRTMELLQLCEKFSLASANAAM